MPCHTRNITFYLLGVKGGGGSDFTSGEGRYLPSWLGVMIAKRATEKVRILGSIKRILLMYRPLTYTSFFDLDDEEAMMQSLLTTPTNFGHASFRSES